MCATVTKGTRLIVTGRLEQREYETQSGEKRNVVEIVADDVGPSLRWARAQIERITRDAAEGSSGQRSQARRDAPAPAQGEEEPW